MTTTGTTGTTRTGADGFVETLRAHSRRYHDQHPFHVRMNAGRLSRRQIQGWVANRFYYQESIPRKDAAILSNCPDLAVRRRWIRRIVDHDGTTAGEGGIEAWLRLGEAAGLTREEVRDHRHLVPGVRFAVDAYVNFARRQPWQEGVISSLTEMFAPKIHADRLAGWPSMYPWIAPEGLAYFRARIPLATRDVEHGLEVAMQYGTTRAKQQRAIEILQFKLDVLWCLLDAVERAYPDDLTEELRP